MNEPVTYAITVPEDASDAVSIVTMIDELIQKRFEGMDDAMIVAALEYLAAARKGEPE